MAHQEPIGYFRTNRFGDQYLHSVNRDIFDREGAAAVFQKHFGKDLFEENSFYVVAGTDSGLLLRFILAQGLPRGSRYLFVELPEILPAIDVLLNEIGCDQEAVRVTSPENWLATATEFGLKRYSLLDRMKLVRSLAVVHSFRPEYLPLWRTVSAEFDYERWNSRTSFTFHYHTATQIKNITENRVPARVLDNAFEGSTAMVLAGGPSLSAMLPWIRDNRRSLIIVSVSRISGQLLKAGIEPDFVVSIDPFTSNKAVSRDLHQFGTKTLLVNGHHVNAAILAEWPGRSVFIGPRYPWRSPLEPVNLPQYGPTVTNAAYAFALSLGCTQIILGGVDFCFANDGYTHAEGSVERRIAPPLTLGDQTIQTNAGGTAETKNSFLQAGNVLDSLAGLWNSQCLTLNPAPGAMQLQNVHYKPLSEIELPPAGPPAAEVWRERLGEESASQRLAFYHEQLKELRRVRTEITAIRKLSRQALRLNKTLCDKNSRDLDSHKHSKIESIEEKINAKYFDTAQFIKRYGIHRFIDIVKPDEAHEWSPIDAQKAGATYYNAYLSTTEELLEIVNGAVKRTESRIAEEQLSPNIKQLVAQWKKDAQFGRSERWLNLHPDTANRLSSEELGLLDGLRREVEKQVNTDEATHAATVTAKRTNLSGVPARALEFLHRRDEESLERLIRILPSQPDKKSVEQIMPLVKGFLEELRGNAASALTEYRKVTGHLHVDALRRILKISMKEGDYPSAREALEQLAEVDATFQPALADLLRLMGNPDGAVDVYTDYLLENPEDLTTMMRLGKLFHEQNMVEGVHWTMSYVLERNPENREARRLLEEIN